MYDIYDMTDTLQCSAEVYNPMLTAFAKKGDFEGVMDVLQRMVTLLASQLIIYLILILCTGSKESQTHFSHTQHSQQCR